MPAFPTWVRYGWRDLTEEPDDVVEVAAMERGIPKQRRTNSDVRVQLNLTLHFDSKTEAANFETWFFTDIRAGQDFFDLVHPRTGATVQARFVGGKLGTLKYFNGTLQKSSRAVQLEYWRAAL